MAHRYHLTRHMDPPRPRPSRHSEPLPTAGSLLRIWPYKFDDPFNEGELLLLNGQWQQEANSDKKPRYEQVGRRVTRTGAAGRRGGGGGGGDNTIFYNNNITTTSCSGGGGIISIGGLPNDGGQQSLGGNVAAEMGKGACTGACAGAGYPSNQDLYFHCPFHYAIAPAVPGELSGFDLSPLQSLKPLDTTTSSSSSAGTSSVATSASTRMTFDSDDGAALDDSDDELSRAARQSENKDELSRDPDPMGKGLQKSIEAAAAAITTTGPADSHYDDYDDELDNGRHIASSAASATDVQSDHYDDSSTNYDDGTSSRDEFLSDAGYESDMVSAGSTSVSSSIWDYRFENGRRYHKFRDGIYNFPNDDPEQEREDMKHGMVRILCEDKLHFAPIGDNPHEILDVGTGTGIWAIEMGDSYPSANVLGIDLSPIQPAWVPPNVRFMVDDVESPWLHPRDHFDYIHSRHTVMAIRNWPKLLRRAHEHIKPGGYMELQEILHIPSSTNGTPLDNNPIAQFWHHVDQGLSNLGIPFQLARGHQLADMMRECGFVNVTERVFDVPLGPWPRDQRLRTVGQFWRVVLTEGLQAIALGPLMRGLQWTRHEVEAFLVEVRRAWETEDLWWKPKMTMPLTCVYGQKPG